MLIAGFPSEAMGTNCWVVAPGDREQCVIIDPGIGISERLDEIIARHHLHPVAVMLTHGHFDHTFSVAPVCQARDVPAFIHPADRAQLADPYSGAGIPVGTPLFGQLAFAEPDDVRDLADGATLALAGLEFAVTHAPGHSPGEVVFSLSEGHHGLERPVLFSGDVLFAGSIGRVDLPGGSMSEMETTLREVIVPLPDAMQVQPGHGPSTSIEHERASNPFLQELV